MIHPGVSGEWLDPLVRPRQIRADLYFDIPTRTRCTRPLREKISPLSRSSSSFPEDLVKVPSAQAISIQDFPAVIS